MIESFRMKRSLEDQIEEIRKKSIPSHIIIEVYESKEKYVKWKGKSIPC